MLDPRPHPPADVRPPAVPAHPVRRRRRRRAPTRRSSRRSRSPAATRAIVFAARWYGTGSPERAPASDEAAREARSSRPSRAPARPASRPQCQLFHAPRSATRCCVRRRVHDLSSSARTRTRARPGSCSARPRRSWCTAAPIPVLVARERPLAAGVVAATRARPADRAALTAAAHIAARLGAELTVVHVAERDDEKRRAELHAELANARALLGRALDYSRVRRPAGASDRRRRRGRRRRARRRRQPRPHGPAGAGQRERARGAPRAVLRARHARRLSSGRRARAAALAARRRDGIAARSAVPVAGRGLDLERAADQREPLAHAEQAEAARAAAPDRSPRRRRARAPRRRRRGR